MEFLHDHDITSLTTFGIPARARLFAEYDSVKELTRISRTPEFIENEVLHLGGGSNLLFIHDFDGLVLHSRILGRTLYKKDEKTVYAIAGAGENWADFVKWTVEQGLSGLENLAGIPGCVGASPVQNVGAYGVEAGDFIHAVEVFDVVARETLSLKGSECGFGYRDSKFKHEWKGKYIVIRVSFRLTHSSVASTLTYRPLDSLPDRFGHAPSPAEVMAEVLAIRAAKLPEPAEIGSAGSFFKNPVVSREYFDKVLKKIDPEMPQYSVPGEPDKVKVPAARLIDKAGMKGFRSGEAQVYPGQCLVIVNTGGATAADVLDVVKHVRRAVKRNFGLVLHPEVNFIDTRMEVTVLGSGTSKGVPEVDCDCEVCTSDDPRDKRRRASVLVRTHGLTLLIDPSPDFRAQALDADLSFIDAVLITHSHYDHVGGIDDLRPFCCQDHLPLYVSPDVADDLRRRVDYCFREHLYPGVPTFSLNTISDETFHIKGLPIVPIRVMHGRLPIFGFRIGEFAYVTDAKTIPAEEMWKLEDLKALIVNALRDKPHFAHFSVSEALALIEEVKPERAWLTHFNHEFGRHAERDLTLPANVHPAYDGLKIYL
ncbi:MAG: UDP-N-acetylmuramate dehydrogenase [Muribaculaceae bacterium]|nr:UDP-N-acetylmuramate dehydrogenase [Muribaculaceae bacterium]